MLPKPAGGQITGALDASGWKFAGHRRQSKGAKSEQTEQNGEHTPWQSRKTNNSQLHSNSAATLAEHDDGSNSARSVPTAQRLSSSRAVPWRGVEWRNLLLS